MSKAQQVPRHRPPVQQQQQQQQQQLMQAAVAVAEKQQQQQQTQEAPKTAPAVVRTPSVRNRRGRTSYDCECSLSLKL
jgi:hypothetical protein